MDYKKIIAATAVTSAAFVVPAIVDAADDAVPKSNLVDDKTYMPGDKIEAAITKITETVDGTTSEDEIMSYQWFIDTSTTSITTAQFEVPADAEGKEIKLVVTTEADKKYYKTIRIPGKSDKLLTQGAYFEGDVIKPPSDMVQVNTSSNGTVESESITKYEWYVDGVLQSQTGESFNVSLPVGKELKLVVTTLTGKKFYKTVKLIAKKSELIEDITYTYGDTLKSSVAEIPTGDTTDKIVNYEWVYKNTSTSSAQNNGFLVPIHAIDETLKLIVTTQSGAKYFDEVTISDMDELNTITFDETVQVPVLVNSSITVKQFDIGDKNDTVLGYEWYYIEKGQYKLLAANDLELDIPIEYAGNEVMFVVKTESGKYYNQRIRVEEFGATLKELDFELKVNGKTFAEDFPSEFLPGDKIEIVTPEIIGDHGEIVDADDLNIQYKWVAINTAENRIALPNVTGSSFTIPVDSEKKDYIGFNVTITVSIPALNHIQAGTSNVSIGVGSSEINSLITAIDELNMEDNINLGEKIKELQDRYNLLNASAKLLVTNYAKLTEYDQTLKVILPLTEQFSKLYEDYNSFLDSNIEVTLKQADLLKRANTLRQATNKLNAKQRNAFNTFTEKASSTTIVKLYEWIVKIDKDSGEDYKSSLAVQKFKDNIQSDVYSDEDYKYQIIQSVDNLKALADFETTVKNYLEEAKTFDKAYQALLKLDVLKMAQTDIKKVRPVIEKINEIATITDKKKRAKAIIAAEKAYNKLNIIQSKLIFEETLSLLTQPFDEDTEQTEDEDDFAVSSLIERINELSSPTNTIDDLEIELDEIAVEYKLLTSPQKKLITNYKNVSVVKKDVSAAKRVAQAILKAEEAKEDADSFENDEKRSKYISKMKSVQSKYNSAYKAYAKLTTTQKALVDGASLETAVKAVTDIIDNEEFAGKQEYLSENAEVVVTKIVEIQTILAEAEVAGSADTISGTDLDVSLQSLITEAKAMYNELNSFEKKLVYNYGFVATASSHLSKANSVKKRLVAATDQKKFNNAKQAFDKLQATQRGLIVGTYEKALNGLDLEETGSLTEIDELLSSFVNSDMEYFDMDQFKELQEQLNPFSTKELKSLKDYSKYQALVKDLKAVDSFVAKLLKLGNNPTYSQKDSIYKAYLKLTRNQQHLFKSYINQDEDSDYNTLFELLDSWNKEAANKAEELNNGINAIIVNGKYVALLEGDTSLEKLQYFESLIAELNKEYKALDSKERKLVVNYSFLKDAQKDMKAVRKLVELEANSTENATSQLEQALNKLTPEQTSLYDLVKP